jgi:hypothetical protein
MNKVERGNIIFFQRPTVHSNGLPNGHSRRGIAGLAQRRNYVGPSSQRDHRSASRILQRQSVEQMACAILRRARSITAAGAHATPRLAAAFASTSSSSSVVAPLRSPLDDRLLRLLRSEITYLAERRPPYPVRQ